MWSVTAKRMRRLMTGALSLAFLLLASPARADELISNLRLNLQGQILADIKLAAPIAAQDGTVKVEFKYGEAIQTVDAGRFPVNVKRTISTAQPFPCDKTLDVTATVVSPQALAGKYVKALLTRRCSRAQGTPDLTVKLEQVAAAVAQRETRVRLRVTVKNISSYNMPDNEQGGKHFNVQVPGSSLPAEASDGGAEDSGMGGTYRLRRALQAGEQYSFEVFAPVPCNGKAVIEARVDFPNVILESDENNNTFRLELKGKPCQEVRLILPREHRGGEPDRSAE